MSAPHAPAPHEGLEALVELGRGGMGIVRLARRPSGELVVTKELRPELVRDVALRRMFVEEARIASRIRGEHVVRVIETGFSPEGAPYLVMEWARGGSLHALALGAEALEDDLFLRVAVDLLLGLAEAHEACDADGAPLGVVHRDVSPHNVLVTTEGLGKILDFGIAKAHDRALETSTGVVKGKPRYLAPEQAARLEVGPAADVFAAGVVVAEHFARRRFWEGMTEPEVFHRLVSGELPDVDTLAPEAPSAVRAVLRGMLAHDPAQRPSARACADALLTAAPLPDDTRARLGSRVRAAFAKELADVDVAVARRSREGPSRSKRPWALVALVAATVVALGAGVAARYVPATRPPPSAEPACTSDGACGPDARCTDAGVCETMAHPGCHVARCGASLGERAVFVGTMLPLSGPDGDSFGLSNERSAELAFMEVNRLAGGVPDGRGGRRPIAVIACDDTKDAPGEARFLASRVPAVVGFGSSDEALATFRDAFLPKGTTVLSALNASPLLSQMPAGDPRRFYRVAPNATAFAEPIAAATAGMLAPDVVRRTKAPKVRVAVVREGNATGIAYAAAILDALASPERRARIDAREVALGEGDARAKTVEALARDAPHVVVVVGDGMMEKLVVPLDTKLSAGARPLYFATTPWEGPAVAAYLSGGKERSKRLFSVSWPTTGRALLGYVERTRETFGEVLTPFTASPGPYESAYVLAYAMAAGGLTGEGIARGISRLVPGAGRAVVPVGPTDVVAGLARLEKGEAIDLEGISSRLDFDPGTGDSKVAAVVLCTTYDAGSHAVGAVDAPIAEGAPLCPELRADGVR